MTPLITALVFLLLVVAVAWVAFWLIDTALPEPIRIIAKVVVGIIGLLVLVQHFVPGIGI